MPEFLRRPRQNQEPQNLFKPSQFQPKFSAEGYGGQDVIQTPN